MHAVLFRIHLKNEPLKLSTELANSGIVSYFFWRPRGRAITMATPNINYEI